MRKNIDSLIYLNTLAKMLKKWRGMHVAGSDVSALDKVIEEIEHYANVQAGVCELDLGKYPLVLFGKEVSVEELNSIDWDEILIEDIKKA